MSYQHNYLQLYTVFKMLELLITTLKKRTEHNPTAAKQTGTCCDDTPVTALIKQKKKITRNKSQHEIKTKINLFQPVAPGCQTQPPL